MRMGRTLFGAQTNDDVWFALDDAPEPLRAAG